MKSQVWVGIALIIFFILVINIFAFGFLPDYLNEPTNIALITKKNNTLTNLNDTSTMTQITPQQTTQNQVTAPVNTQSPSPPVRISRAS